MAHDDDTPPPFPPFRLPESFGRNARVAAIAIAVVALLPAWGVWTWVFCRIEVPQGRFAVLTAKTGANLPPDQILALDASQKGIQLDVLPEGRHFRNPLFWDWDVYPLTTIPAGKVGVLTRLYGKVPDEATMRQGRVLVAYAPDAPPTEHERGIVREVLEPGRSYRVNPHAYTVEIVDAQSIEPGFVGVVTRLDGPNAAKPNAYLVKQGEKGIQPEALQPGTHYLNPRAAVLLPVSVQSQRFELMGDNALVFPSEDGFDMRVLLTVEWSIDPKRAPEVFPRIGVGDPETLLHEIRKKVIIPAVRGYGRVEGSKFPAIDYISGEKRLVFQRDVFEKLKASVEAKGIIIHSVLVNDILPPQELAQPIREREVAKEELTRNDAQRDQAKAEQQLAREDELIKFAEAKVKAETEKLKKEIAANNRREIALRQREATLIEAQRALEEAKLRAAAIESRGRAEADVIVFGGEAEGGRSLEAAVSAFGQPDLYAKYVFAQRAGPAIDTVLAGTTSPFGQLFEDLVRFRPSAGAPPPASSPGGAAGTDD